MDILFIFTLLFLSLTELLLFLPVLIKKRMKIDDNFSPALSIIIPVKDEEEIIEDVVNKWLNVSYDNERELIFIDQSSDSTFEKLKNLSKKYPDKIRVFHSSPKKLTKFTAELEGIKKANNDYIVICDADKIPDKDSLSITKYLSEKDKIGAVFQNTVPRNQKNLFQNLSGMELMNKYIDQKAASVLDSVPYLSLSTAVIKKDLLSDIEPDKALISDDILFAIKIREKGYRALLVNNNISTEGVVSNFRDFLKKRLRVSYGTYQAAIKNYFGSQFNHSFGLLGLYILPIRNLNYFLGGLIMPMFLLSSIFVLINFDFKLVLCGYLIILLPFLLRALSIISILKYKRYSYLLTVFIYPLYYLFLYKAFASLAFYRAIFGFSVKWKKTSSDRSIK